MADVVQRFDHLPPEVLAAQDGKKVPLTAEPGGPVIGEATLKYVPADAVLEAHFTVNDPKIAELIKSTAPFAYSIKKESK